MLRSMILQNLIIFFGSSSLRIRVDFFSILELPFFSLVDSFLFFFVGVHQYTNIS